MKGIAILAYFAIILTLQSSTCQQITEDKNNVLEWYYNLNQNPELNFNRKKRQTRRFNHLNFNNNDDDEWYVFDEVEPQPPPQTRQGVFSNNQFSWFQRQQTNRPPFGQFIPQTTTTSQPAIPNAGGPRPPRCVERCMARTTPQYDPVCGSNGMTYDNLAKMKCASSCGLGVQFIRLGRCAPFLP